MKFSAVALTLAASVTYTQAASFYWKHNSEWNSAANWEDGELPEYNDRVGFGIAQIEGTPSSDCDSGFDTMVNIPYRESQETGGFYLANGISIIIGTGAEIVLNEPDSENVLEWRCKTEQEVDFFCSANWFKDARMTIPTDGAVPCSDDDVFFKESMMVNNEGVALVKSVIVEADGGDTEYESVRRHKIYILCLGWKISLRAHRRPKNYCDFFMSFFLLLSLLLLRKTAIRLFSSTQQ